MLFGKVPKRYIEGSDRNRRTGEVRTIWSPDLKLDGLWEMVPFTGGLLLGADFIGELYVHMGFHPAWNFRTVHELVLETGQVVEQHNRSERMEELRSHLAIAGDGLQSEATLAEWIKQCFSLKYDRFGN
jgi:hypothetical protein